MTKVANGRGIAVTLVADDSVGDLKLIGSLLCRITSKSSPTRGVVHFDGVVEVTKGTGAWAQFQKIYRTGAGAYTATEGSNTEVGVAAAPAASGATSGLLLLNGLPAIWGD